MATRRPLGPFIGPRKLAPCPLAGQIVRVTEQPFGAATRRAQWSALPGEPADLLVIGGGITGAGIARDAAMRGIRTLLVDAGDFGWGTSSRSSRLIHGGLRYLEHGWLRLVFEASRERRILLRIAPHLVWPRKFLFPAHQGSRVKRWEISAGVLLYGQRPGLRSLWRLIRSSG